MAAWKPSASSVSPAAAKAARAASSSPRRKQVSPNALHMRARVDADAAVDSATCRRADCSCGLGSATKAASAAKSASASSASGGSAPLAHRRSTAARRSCHRSGEAFAAGPKSRRAARSAARSCCGTAARASSAAAARAHRTRAVRFIQRGRTAAEPTARVVPSRSVSETCNWACSGHALASSGGGDQESAGPMARYWARIFP